MIFFGLNPERLIFAKSIFQFSKTKKTKPNGAVGWFLVGCSNILPNIHQNSRWKNWSHPVLRISFRGSPQKNHPSEPLEDFSFEDFVLGEFGKGNLGVPNSAINQTCFYWSNPYLVWANYSNLSSPVTPNCSLVFVVFCIQCTFHPILYRRCFFIFARPSQVWSDASCVARRTSKSAS